MHFYHFKLRLNHKFKSLSVIFKAFCHKILDKSQNSFSAAAGVPLSTGAAAQMQSQANQNPNPNPIPVPASQTLPSSSGVPAMPMPTSGSVSGASGNPG